MSNNTQPPKKIKIALLTAEPFFWKTSAPIFFKIILDKYTWIKNNHTYQFNIQEFTDQDIRKGKLINDNIDILLIPGGGIGDGHSISKGFKLLPTTKKWKKNIQQFIKSGGGCLGICGGTSLITPLSTGETTKPTTFVERQYNKSSLGISSVYSYYKNLAFPLLYPFQYKHPENIGTTAYVFSYKPGKTSNGTSIHTGGIPLEFSIDHTHPIFKDYPDKTLRMRWWGGPALIIPTNTKRSITTIATYPKKELHSEKHTQIHAWRYIGGIIGLLKGLIKTLNFIKKNTLSLTEIPMLTYYFAGDWQPTDALIKSDLANRPAITTEIYPNSNKARITLCTTHPEYMIWYNGKIQETKNNFNCLAYGFYQWNNIKPFTQPEDYQITHSWWLLRRLVAWTAKIPDTDLPPIEKQKLTKTEKEKLKPNIHWDGTLYNQIQNI